MEFREVLRRRRMVRDYTDQPLAPEVVERVLDAALRAPSAGSAQGWAFLVLTAVGYRHPDLAPQDSTSIEERRRRQQDVVHRGHW